MKAIIDFPVFWECLAMENDNIALVSYSMENIYNMVLLNDSTQ